MEQMIQAPKKKYEALLEEVGIVRDEDVMASIKESDKAKKADIKTWKLTTQP